MTAPFVAESDLEAYCYLKYALAGECSVESFPRTAYYSEWLYHYEIRRGQELLHVLEGDFRELPPGRLAAQARRIVAEAQHEPEPGGPDDH